MRRILKIEIPFEFLNTKFTIANKELMTPLQKIVAALIVASEGSDFETMTLKEAIEKQLGIYSHNIYALKPEVEKIFKKNLDPALTFNQAISKKVAVLRYMYNKELAKNILNEEKYNISNQVTRQISKKVLLPIFNFLKIEKNTDGITIPKQAFKFQKEINYDESSKKDIAYGMIEKDLKSYEITQNIIIDEPQIVWKKYEINFKIENDTLITLDDISRNIISYIYDQKMEIDFMTLWNNSLIKWELKQTDNNFNYYPYSLENKKLKSNNFFESKFLIENDMIQEFFLKITTVKINKAIEKLNFIVFKEQKIIEFFRKNYSYIREDLLNLFANKDKLEFIKIYLNKTNKVSRIMEITIRKYMTIDLFNKLDQGKKIFMQNSILRNDLIRKTKALPKAFFYDYANFLEKSYSQTLIDLNYQYTDQVIFDDWKEEKEYLSIISKTKSIKTKIELLEIKNQVKKLSKFFQNQKYLWKMLDNLEDKIKLKGE